MLQSLSIRNALLIEKLDLEFQAGLNVLTGETGAGKSILLDCLGFVLGWRGRADMVRPGAEAGEVSAVFSLSENHPALAILEEAGLASDEDLMLRRTVGRDGRKTGFVNDRRVSGEILRQLSGTLVELHGQRDDRGLLDTAGHRALLDAYGGHSENLNTVRQAWSEQLQARNKLKQAQEKLEIVARDAEFLRHAVDELDTLDARAGEDDELDARRRLMQASGRVREDVSRAGEALGLNGAEGLMSDATRWLEDAADAIGGALDKPKAALERALDELANAQRGVDDCLRALDFDPLEVERVEERLFAIRNLARKHNVAPDALGDLAASFRSRLDHIETGAEHLAELQTAVSRAEKKYQKQTLELSKARAVSGRRLDEAMQTELPPLKLEHAVFVTGLEALDTPGPDGAEKVNFTVATNPGSPAGPIAKIASGGELSRFLLALKVCLTRRSSELTMIFDEIDRGVGGATADAVGRRLGALARHGQILVVTHSPQVAARGAHHWRVSKSVTGKQTRTDVVDLDPGARVEEIARMLSGDVVTQAARSAAEALLAD